MFPGTARDKVASQKHFMCGIINVNALSVQLSNLMIISAFTLPSPLNLSFHAELSPVIERSEAAQCSTVVVKPKVCCSNQQLKKFLIT